MEMERFEGGFSTQPRKNEWINTNTYRYFLVLRFFLTPTNSSLHRDPQTLSFLQSQSPSPAHINFILKTQNPYFVTIFI